MSGNSWRRDGRLAVVLALVTVAGAVSCRRSRSTEPAASPAGDGQATVPRPSAAELDAYLSGAGGVHLGMTVSEVSDAFDAKPTRRQEAPSRGVPVDVVWDTIGGPRPGGALGLFEDDRLRRIEFIPRHPDLPRITQAAADTFLTGEIARRSYERTLRMSEIEAVTGPGLPGDVVHRRPRRHDARGQPVGVGGRARREGARGRRGRRRRRPARRAAAAAAMSAAACRCR